MSIGTVNCLPLISEPWLKTNSMKSIFCSQALLVTSSSSLPTPQVDSTRNVIQLIQHHRCTIYPNTVERSDVLGFTFPTAEIA